MLSESVPGGAGRGSTLAFATRDDVEIVAVADNNERSLDALEKGLRECVEGYKKTVSNATSVSMSSSRC